MKYRQLADTGVFVSELCLGTMTFGGRGQIWEMIGGKDNMKAVDVTLAADDLNALNEVSKLTPEYPEWMDSLGSDRRPGERRY